MHPILFEIGPIPIRFYGVLIAVAFAIGIWLAVRRAERRGIDPLKMTDLGIWIMIASVVGSRLLYVIPYWDYFAAEPARIFAVWEGGLTMYGGLIAAVAVSAVFTRRAGISFRRTADVTAPSIALGLGITRIGCFFNGCCFGHPTACALGVRFPAHSAAGAEFPGVPIHPTQLYAAAFGFALFGFLLFIEKRIRGDGRLFLVLIGLYGAARIVLDQFRFYENVSPVAPGGVPLSWNTLLSAALIVLSLALYPFLGGSRDDRR
ncbi:MAG: prolipoprotein diacylglyceryl transferase [Candidatus Eisenbacteria bacterium]|nr:prolipoprotein diacylglyceryl transferase [Candidatus Eisenbacteria bacterium]